MSTRAPGTLLGVREIATLLGVSRQRADQITRTKQFPDPVARLAAGAVWDARHVMRWGVAHNYLQSRPR
jgi:predicted DNA-binding transcriptional regulator AlpA